MDWGGGTIRVNLSAAQSSAGWLLAPLAARNSYVDPTIMRLITRHMMRYNGGVILGTGGAIGMGIIAWDSVNDQIPGFLPGPVTSPEVDWMTRSVIIVPDQTPVGLLAYQQDDVFASSSAKRRLGNQSGLLWVLESTVPSGAFFIGADARFLLKE
jgi:hypothetical protein